MIFNIVRRKTLTDVTIDGIKIHLMDIISPTLKNDIKFMKELVKEDYRTFFYSSENLKNNIDFIKSIINKENASFILNIMDEQFRKQVLNDSRFIESILTVENYCLVLDSMDEQLKNDKTFAKKVLENYPAALSSFSENIRYDKEIIESLFIQSGFSILIMLDNKLENDKIFAKKVLENHPEAFWCFSEEIQNDGELIESVLTEENVDIIILKVGKKYALENKEFVKKHWANILKEVPKYYIDIKSIFPYDIDLAKVAVSNDKSGMIYHILTNELKENPEIKNVAIIKPINELVQKIINQLPDKSVKPQSDITNPLTFNQGAVDVEDLVKRIDEKIAQLEEEEKYKRKD